MDLFGVAHMKVEKFIPFIPFRFPEVHIMYNGVLENGSFTISKKVSVADNILKEIS